MDLEGAAKAADGHIVAAKRSRRDAHTIAVRLLRQSCIAGVAIVLLPDLAVVERDGEKMSDRRETITGDPGVKSRDGGRLGRGRQILAAKLIGRLRRTVAKQARKPALLSGRRARRGGDRTGRCRPQWRRHAVVTGEPRPGVGEGSG